MINDIQTELASGSYVAAIQDLLGNKGSSTTIGISGAQSATATGAPSPLASTPAVILSLSPAARDVLSNAQIALELITAAGSSGHVKSAPAAARSSPDNGISSKPAVEPGQPPSAALVPSIASIVADARDSLSDPTATFYSYVNSVGGPAEFASFMRDGSGESFVKAFNSQTLTIQNASDVAGLGYTDTTSLTGTSETVSTSVNQEWIASQEKSTGTYATVLCFPVIGGLYVTWADPSASSAASNVSGPS